MRQERLRRFILISIVTAVSLHRPAFAQQVLRFDSPNSCDAQGGTLTGTNLITTFDNGTFGEEPSGAPNQSPSTDPFPGLITGGNYVPFFSNAFGFGDYAILSNAFEPRNGAQHREITDPLNGVTGRSGLPTVSQMARRTSSSPFLMESILSQPAHCLPFQPRWNGDAMLLFLMRAIAQLSNLQSPPQSTEQPA